MQSETTAQDWQRSCHEDVLKVLAYWQGKCRGRKMPSRADIDPIELGPFLPQITLVDVVADGRRFVYRLVGTAEVRLRGNDPTGKAVADGFFAATPQAALDRYQRVCTTRAPFYEEDDFQVVDRYISEANLFLPLSEDGETVNMVMVFSINRDLYC
ncbi:MAG TPA: PAS domain-containing protein [Dongiaceae bacterium]|nr:PAS domain-containing protein [Dongiaceae bacterium]